MTKNDINSHVEASQADYNHTSTARNIDLTSSLQAIEITAFATGTLSQ